MQCSFTVTQIKTQWVIALRLIHVKSVQSLSGTRGANTCVQATLGSGRLIFVHEAFANHGIDMRHGRLI